MTLCSNQGHGSRLKEDPSRYRKGGSNASSPEPEPPKKEAGSKLNFITDQVKTLLLHFRKRGAGTYSVPFFIPSPVTKMNQNLKEKWLR